MNEAIIIPSRSNLVDAVLTELHPDGLDYSRSMVVFPGKRPGHFLRKAIAERVHSSFLPPRIFSIDNFIAYLASDHLDIHRTMLKAEDAAALLFEVHSQGNHALGGNHYRTFDTFFTVGLKLFGELEEVMLTNLPAKHIHGALKGIEYEKFHSFGTYYEEFYRAVEEQRWMTRSMMYRSVADRIDEIDYSRYGQIIVAGLYALTATERAIVTGLRRRENVQLIFQNGIGLPEKLNQLGISIAENNDRENISPSIHYYSSPDTHGQVFALAAQLQKHHNANRDERTAIVLPSAEALFPVLHHALSHFEEHEYNISLGYPLSRTPVYGFLQSILELVASVRHDKFSSAAYLRFMLHPYVKNIRFRDRSDIARIVIHSIEEYFIRTGSKTIFALDEIENNDELFESIARRIGTLDEQATTGNLQEHCRTIHDRTIKKFLHIASIQDFALRSIEVLQYIFEQSTARQHPYFHPYVEHAITFFDRLSRSPIGNQRFEDTAGYMTFLRNAVASQTVPFSGTPLHGLQVLGFLETRNLSFDTVYFFDANDDILPGRNDRDLLLPFPVRKMLGLETSHDRELLTEYYFNLLVASAKEVHLFYNEAGKKEKSRFVQKLLWKYEQSKQDISSDGIERKIRYSVNLGNGRPESVKKTALMIDQIRKNVRFSASALNTYLACPLKFYYRHVLGLNEKIEISDDIDSSDIGTIVHTILKEYFKPLIGKRLTRDSLDDKKLNAVIDRCFKESFGEEFSGSIYLMKEQVVRQLQSFLLHYQMPVADGSCMITGLERDLTIDYRGFTFTGRIDRIEMRNEKIYILDYKTGYDEKRNTVNVEKLIADRRETWREAIGSFQLPLYMLLYATFFKRPIEQISPAIIFLGKQLIDQSIEVRIGDETHTAHDVFQKVEPVMFALLDEILDREKDWVATDTVEQDCPRCPFTTLCGTSWVRGWKA